jgi:hypothetical protein
VRLKPFSEGIVWTSLTNGHDYRLRLDGEYLYADAVNLQQNIKEGGGFIRYELKRDQDGKWRGKARGHLPCSYGFQQSFTQWCSTEHDAEIHLMSTRRI